MSWWVLVAVVGLPALGAFITWGVGLRAWLVARSQIPRSTEGREERKRLVPLMILPSTLIVFALVASFLLLGETVPDATALPAALAYGVPGLLTGVGIALVYRRGIPTAAASKRGFGLVIPLAVMPETSAIFGLTVAFFLIGGGSGTGGSAPFPTVTAWLASALAMASGVGGLLSGWIAASSWDFRESETSPRRYAKVLSKASRGGTLSVLLFALALALFAEWLIVLLMALYFAAVLAVGAVLFVRARRKRQQAPKLP